MTVSSVTACQRCRNHPARLSALHASCCHSSMASRGTATSMLAWTPPIHKPRGHGVPMARTICIRNKSARAESATAGLLLAQVLEVGGQALQHYPELKLAEPDAHLPHCFLLSQGGAAWSRLGACWEVCEVDVLAQAARLHRCDSRKEGCGGADGWVLLASAFAGVRAAAPCKAALPSC